MNRRGMLLLMVLLMLALFMAIGSILLTIAARARAAARASMGASQQSTLRDAAPRSALDNALMALLRGATSGTSESVTITGSSGQVWENLLHDKYGRPITGTGSITSGTNSPVLTLSLTGLSSSASTPFRLNGRVLTIQPRTGDGDVASYRILGATGTSGATTCYVAQMPSTAPRTFPTGSFGVTINGREFTQDSVAGSPESYDAFDDANLWLAQPLLANGQVSGSFSRLSFSGTTGSPVVDNDNDGVLDGIWIPSNATISSAISSGSATPPPYIIPDQPSPLGGTLRFQVSYLILDLDGRLNVNTAGMASAPGTYAWTPLTPIGMGYGSADINANLLFPATLPAASGTYPFTGVWPRLLLSGTPTTTPADPSETQRRSPPIVGIIDGRYGPNANAGISGEDTNGNQQTSAGTNAILNTTTGGTDSIYTLTIAGNNAIADLKAQTRLYMTNTATGQVTPTLNFYRPSWSGTAGSDAIDDPYEVRLDTDAPRPSTIRRPPVSGTINDDNPFTLAELERILRANDVDAPQLPQRLASGLEDLAQRSRMTITTDSWDTPGLTGLAARKIEDFIAGSGTGWSLASDVMSPDIAAGLRFNINRPVLSGTTMAAVAQQQEFCKGLYTLVVALSGTTSQPLAADAAQYAQWAANVLDFRDGDSVMTRFAYDVDLSDGWQVTSASPVVYGAERPELVIAETAAWRDTVGSKSQLFVNLHRPASTALLITATTGTTALSGTTEISTLATSGSLSLSGWQLRFGGGNAVSFSNVGPSGTTQTQSVLNGAAVSSQLTSLSGGSAGAPAGLVTNGTGAYVCVLPVSSGSFSASGIPTFIVDQGLPFQFPPTAQSGTVYLERLANPNLSNSGSNPYIVVDSAVLNSIADVSDSSFNPADLRKNRRTGPLDTPNNPLAVFWTRHPAVSPWTPDPSRVLTTYSVSGTALVPWFHWPNRPFISQAELALVPTGSSSTDGVLAQYSFPTNSLATSTASIAVSSMSVPLGSLVVDATYVPSRFAENALTVTGSAINIVGLDRLQANHFSKWREPGRVNVNTIASGTLVSGTTVSGSATGRTDDFVWALLSGGTGVALTSGTSVFTIASLQNPFIPAASGTVTPATSIAQMLSLTGTASQPISTETFASSTSTFNPRDKNPYFTYGRAIRLANTATIRSNVFAVWITVKITDDSPNAGSPVTKRLFAIIDRSIPVGYSPNQDLNVADTIRLKRYLD